MADIGIQLRTNPQFDTDAVAVRSAPLCILPSLVGFSTLLILKIFTQLTVTPLLQVFALALIVSSPIAFVSKKFAEEQVALGNQQKIFPAAVGVLLLTGILSALGGLVFFFIVPSGTSLLKGVAVLAQVYVAMNFVALSFPAVFRRIRLITVMMFGCYCLSIFAACCGFRLLHNTGLLAGFTIGQVVLLVLLLRVIRVEFGPGDGSLATWIIPASMKRFKYPALCGLALPLGLWIDKMIPLSNNLDWHVTSFALLFAAPGIFAFSLHLRTDFSPALEIFNKSVRSGATLDVIRLSKTGVVRAFNSGFSQLVIIQLIVTSATAFYATNIGSLFQFSPAQVSTFQVALVGTFLAVVFLSLISVLFYLGDFKGAALTSVTFAFLHTALLLTTLSYFEKWHGCGFVIASGLAMLITVFRVNHNLSRIEHRLIGV